MAKIAVMRTLSPVILLAMTASYAQTPPPAILRIQADSYVRYVYDGSPVEKWGLLFVATPIPPRRGVEEPAWQFDSRIGIGDVSRVNGFQVKGTVVEHSTWVLSQSDFPRTATGTAPFNRDGPITWVIEIADERDRSIGTLVGTGMSGGPPPAGITATRPQGWGPPIWSIAITGGTGVFAGARGQLVTHTNQTQMTYTSVQTTTAPSVRRRISNTPLRLSAHVIPESRPEVVRNGETPAVFHEDWSPVTSAKPARPGEFLIFQATGLGPTDPPLEPGQTFPSEPLSEVLAPVRVVVNGQVAEVATKTGWPGTTDRYRIDVRVPPGISGSATLQIEAAWIPGGLTIIPVER